MPTNILDIQNLNKKYHETEVLKDISETVKRAK